VLAFDLIYSASARSRHLDMEMVAENNSTSGGLPIDLHIKTKLKRNL